MTTGLLEQIRTASGPIEALNWDRDYIPRQWADPVLVDADIPLGSLTEYYAIVPDVVDSVRSPARRTVRCNVCSPVRGPNYLANSSITTTAGTDAAAVSGNNITIPSGYNALAVWIGEQTRTWSYISLNVKVGSTTTTTRVITNGFYIIQAAEGSVVSFASQVKIGTSASLSNQAVTLSVCPMATPASLVTPSSVSGTANCDKAGPPVWSPSGTAHIVQGAENLTFQIGASSGRREFFLVERDGGGALTPIRHIHVPDSTAVTVQMRHREAYLANYTGSTASITGPVGCAIGGTSTTHRPSFTVVRQVDVTTAAELNTALTNAQEGDDIVCAAGTYSMTVAGYQITTGNYGSAMGKNIRLRGATGTASDVVFTNRQALFGITTGKRWVVESIRWNLPSVTSAGGLVDITGCVDLHNVEVIGPSASGQPTVAVRVNSGQTAVNYFTWCTFTASSEDNLDLDGTNGTLTVHMIGGVGDSNGSAASDQVATSHVGAALYLWGVRFTDAANTTNGLRIAYDSSPSTIYLLFCRCSATDVTHAAGLNCTVNMTAIWFCDFAAFFQVRVNNHAVGSRLLQRANTGTRFVSTVTAGIYPVVMGCYCQGTNFGGSGYEAGDFNTFADVIGTYFESQSNNVIVNLARTNPAAAETVTMTGCVMKGANPPTALQWGTAANCSGSLRNCILDASTASAITVNSTGGTFSLANNYFRRASAPTNWDTRFSSNPWSGLTGGTDPNSNNASSTAPGLSAAFVPTAGGNCDNEGSTPSWLGGCDIYGRPLYLGSTFVRGCVEIPEIRSAALFYPGQW